MVNEVIIDFANKCIGYQVATKNTHWINKSNSNHLYADDFYEKLVEFTDEILEDSSYTYGRLEHGQIQPYEYDFETLEDLIYSFIDDLILFREGISSQNNPRDYGLVSLCDDFIHVVNQYGYRSQLK